MRTAVLLLCAVFPGCTAQLADSAAAGEQDAAADAAIDAASPDTTALDQMDVAEPKDATATAAPDIFVAIDTANDGSLAIIPCTVNGIQGECKPVATCAGTTTPGFCPGAKDIQCCTAKNANAKCDENAKPTPNVGLIQTNYVKTCPDGMLAIDTFCVDKYEASLLQLLPNGTKVDWSPYWNPGTEKVVAVSSAGAVPQGYISGVQAANACKLAGKRLCTDKEWLRACQGSKKTTYPYGNALQLGLCNDHRDVHPAVEYYGTSANWIYSKIQNPCLNQLAKSLAPTGAHLGCVTEDGAFDMMGNLHEWTADPNGTFRGGYYVDTKINGPGCLYATTAHDVQHWDYSTGFRCCADVK